MLTLTATASEKIRDLIAEEGNPDLKVRLFIEGVAVLDLIMVLRLMRSRMMMIGK